MKIISEEFISSRISKNLTIKTSEGEIIINRWIEENTDGSDDEGWDVVEGMTRYYELSEEDRDELADLIYSFDMNK